MTLDVKDDTLLRNLEAEQVLLGAILIRNNYLDYIDDIIVDECFDDPIHRKIFGAVMQYRARNIVANPLTLKAIFSNEATEGYEYLNKLIEKAYIITDVEHIAKLLFDLYMKRSLVNLCEDTVRSIRNNVEILAMQHVEDVEQQLFQLAIHGNYESTFKQLSSSVAQSINSAEFAYKNQGSTLGIPTGFSDLDHLLGGLQNSDLLIVAGRPSMGKTALAVNIALNACKTIHRDNRGIGFFSLEMSAEQLATRMLSMESGINSNKIRSGRIGEDDFHKIIRVSQDLHELPFYIDDTPALSITSLRTRARRLKRKHNIGLIVIDYLQLINASRKSFEKNRVQEVSEITQGLKSIAKELNIPVIALSQLSRLVEQREDKRPQLSDLRDSGTIEQDADIVMFIFREEYYERRKQPTEGTEKHAKWQEKMNAISNISEIILAKQRNGPIGNIRLYFDANTTIFKDLLEDSSLQTG